MNTLDNKKMLWELTNHLYKAWMDRQQVITAFEKTIQEIDGENMGLIEKNKKFLQVYVGIIQKLQPVDAAQRALLFEERLKPKKIVSFSTEERPLEESLSPPLEVVTVVDPQQNTVALLRALQEDMAAVKEDLATLMASVRTLLQRTMPPQTPNMFMSNNTALNESSTPANE